VIEWEPTANEEVEKVATPLLFSAVDPSVLEPSLNVTLPVGVPAPEVSVAVRVTLTPEKLGLVED